ncbi:MAG: phosphoribosylglycinamide formyltransferase [Alphaproteobacteria bacterium RIFCSPHIGHO2_12_FULL_45_9]|nr:MAG: phosphoribosylglycinamide formyltransferase [Alphaproteobacteria bacterium RIFCSPHIGHO2_02_FULL_46_13]OFW93645.1 MAG: phosphoribosylglycinamide formyltransferase [Alphaproteobacteria bacterium RIFCSPHIGHO2_12_FULL_45_9]
MGGISQQTNPNRKLRLAVLISGRGSNLQSIIDACRIDEFPAQIKVVISNIGDAYGLVRAHENNITTRFVSHKNFATKAEFETKILSILEEFEIDLVCLAGFMRILSPTLITPWEGRIINIHPSLLPKHKGLHTHERALEEGDSESGCTIHYVTPGMDEGEIILQKTVPIIAGDTPETLAARVLVQEHIAYPEAIRIMASKLQHNL